MPVTVHFIGAGPGSPDLLTLRAQRLIAGAPVCLYAGALVPAEIIAHAPPGARLVDTQLMNLDEIIAECVAAHQAGLLVSRLHSGDLSIFSAAAEQMRRLDDLAIGWDVTPGVPAFAAAAAALRCELTVPGIAQTVILTRYGRRASAMPAGEELTSLASHGATLVVHLGAQAIVEIVGELVGGYGEDCPAAVVAWASWPEEIVVRGTLASIAGLVQAAGVRRTATIIVGPALDGVRGSSVEPPGRRGLTESHLYSKARDRPARDGR